MFKMNSPKIVAFFYLCVMIASCTVLAQWNCPFDYRCGKRELSDAKANDDTISKNLMDRLRLLRGFRSSPDVGKPVKAERGLDNRADTEDLKGSLPWEE